MRPLSFGAAQDPTRPIPPANAASKRHFGIRSSLLLKHVVFLTLAILLVSGILGHLAYLSSKEMLLDDVYQRLELIAAARARLLEAAAAEQLRDTALVASRTRLRSLVAERNAGAVEEPAFRREVERVLSDASQVGGGFRQLWIVDLQGEVVAATDESLHRRAFGENAVFKQGLHTGTLGVPQWRSGQYLTEVAAPLLVEDRPVAVLMGELDVTSLMDGLFDRIGLGETGEVVAGRFAADKIDCLISSHDPSDEAVPMSADPALAAACQGKTGTEIMTSRGAPALVAYRPVAYGAANGPHWGLVAKMDLAEAYAPTERLRRILFAAQCAFALAAAAASYWLARRLTRPIVNLTAAAAALASGRLEQRVPVASNDELGLLEQSFNHMAEQLAEARGRLEQSVEQRTAELSQSQLAFESQGRILKSILDSMADGVIVADLAGNCLLWNPAAERIIGMGPQEALPSDWSRVYGCYEADGKTLCPAEDLPLARAMRGEAVDGAELFLRRADLPAGCWININGRPLRNERGDLLGGVIAFRDVTAIKRAEAEIKAGEEINRAILATAHEAFVAIDADSVIVQWNREAELTFGWSTAEALGRRLTETIIPERFRSLHLAGIRRFLETGDETFFNQRHELSALHRDGHEFSVDVTIAPVRTGDSYLFSAFVRDVTESLRAKRELERAKQLAEAASRAKSEFMANMSHEIRTPMNAVIGMTELVLETALTTTQREYLTMVLESGESLLAVINDILDFSKIEAGRFELEQSAFDLREALGDTMKSLAVRAHRKGLELACHVSPETPHFVVGDKHRLRQIVVNLAGNAIKFTEQGEVVLDVMRASAVDHQVELHFVVRDTGIGIPADKQQLIFEAFEQADESTTRRFGGTGLGLTISTRLVELMGGRIWVRSEPGKGSEFHFTTVFALPEAGSELPAVRSEKSLHGVRALVVDDNRTNCFILEEMLRSWGMQPTTASRPAEAVPLMRERLRDQRPFDVVLVDVNMPELNGFQLIEQIKQVHELRCAAVIVLTSGGRAADARQREELGIAACLTKPVKQSELFDAISQCLESASRLSEAPAGKPPEDAESPIRPLHILLVEDSVVNQKLALALLEPKGHTVVVAGNGAEGVRKYAAEQFDLVLMDVQMPEMDGLEATRIIREQERQSGRRTPILAMTAHAIKGDRELCLHAGMDAYVSKPVRARELYAAIAQLISDGAPTKVDPGRNARVAAEQSAAAAADRAATAGDGEAAKPSGDKQTEQALDWNAVCSKSELGEDSLRELAALFLQECPKLLAEIRAAIANLDAPRLRLAAHTLKGSAAIFEARKAASLAQQLESQAAARDFAGARDLAAALETEAERVAEALESHAVS